MVRFKVPDDKRYDLAHHFEVAQRVAAEISATFPSPIELEFEKCYYPYLLFAKKRYAGAMYTSPDRIDYVDVKGLSIVRRDFAPIAKIVSQAVLDALMLDKSSEKAIEAARGIVLDVVRGNRPLEEFVLSKTLRSGYKNDSLPHVAVARKLKERTGAAPHSGERVPYVFVRDDANPTGLQTERAEHPDYVANVLDIDLLYYVDHQLTSPVVGLLELVVDDPMAAVFGHGEIEATLGDMRARHKGLVKTAKRIKTNALNKQFEITKFFAPQK